MARPVVLGNSSLTVALNEFGLVHDFYYPYVGLENLTTARSMHHKIGVWAEGIFSWTDSGDWQTSINFENEALVSQIVLTNTTLGVRLYLQDFVDSEHNAFIRRIKVENISDSEKEVRIFMHQVFQISQQGRGDTALFVPEENYILDYKGRCCLLIYGQTVNGLPFDQYAIGNYGIEGKEGTFKDAEDGELSNNAVEHGGVDSVIRLQSRIAPSTAAEFDYWIVASDSQFKAQEIHEQIITESVAKRLASTRHFWSTWLSIGQSRYKNISSDYLPYVKKSLMLIKAHTDKRGGIIASCDSSIYNYGRDYYSYVWPRDGAYAMWPLIRLGYTNEPKKFFEFCRDILTRDGYMMHKYQPDRAVGSTWHPLVHNQHKELAIQEDETAIILYMLGEYYEYTQDRDFTESLYETLIRPAANFLSKFCDELTGLPHASYDLWEEKFGTHTYTVAVTYQALLVAADFAEAFAYTDDADIWNQKADQLLKNRGAFFDQESGYYRKGFLCESDGTLTFDNILDVSSLYGVVMFGYHEKDLERIHSTQQQIEEQLLDVSPSGGTARYVGDRYFASEPAYNGNPWLVTTLWMAQYYQRAGDKQRAKQYLEWTLEKTLQSGVLSEQINPTSSVPVSVTPLVWSHAELVNTILDISRE